MTKRISKYKDKFKTGDKFGNWTVIDGIIHGSPASIDLMCICNTKKRVDVYTLVKGKSTSCGCKKTKLVGSLSSRWSGSVIGNMSGTAISKNLNKTKLITGSCVTDKDLLRSYEIQNGICALTGRPIDDSSSTISRINNSLPYTPNNIMWVHNTVSPIARSLGAIGSVNLSSNVISNNIFEKLGMKKEK
jgi:hypothetical protein